MITPNFLIVGVQKAGTTVLHSTLSEHPEVFMSDKKEINFFTIDKYYNKGINEYSKHFDNVQLDKHLVYGEASPGYICYPNVAKRIKNDLGDIKIIISLRDPIKRGLSQYWDNRRHFNEPYDFSESLEKYLSPVYKPGNKGYFSRGLYIDFIHEYLKYFPKENIHVIIFEELVNNTQNVLLELCDFLNISSFPQSHQLSKESNSSMIYDNLFYKFLLDRPKIASKVPKRLRRLFLFGDKKAYKYMLPKQSEIEILTAYYKPSIDALEDYIGRNLGIWNLSNNHSDFK